MFTVSEMSLMLRAVKALESIADNLNLLVHETFEGTFVKECCPCCGCDPCDCPDDCNCKQGECKEEESAEPKQTGSVGL
jgi:hypothetical protein